MIDSCYTSAWLLAVVGVSDQVSVAPGIYKEDSVEWDPASLYYTLQSVLDMWQSSHVHYQKEARTLLNLFKHRCFSTPESWDPDEPFATRRPFINIEGNANVIRDHIGRRVAEALKGKFFVNPPPCLVPLKNLYGVDGHKLHLPYMALGMYASSHAVKTVWGNMSAVMTGYWNDLAAATIADLFINETIPRASTLYEFPKDLLKPDLTFFVDTLNHVPDSREETRPLQWKSKFTEAFLRFKDIQLTRVIWFDADNVTDTILQLIEGHVETNKLLEIP